MSKKFFEKLKKTKEQISLSKSEQVSGRNELLSFMKNNSVIKNETARHNIQKDTNFLNFSSLTNIFMNKTKLAYIALPVLLLFGAGISFAAENSLPGDFLYPVKTNINEAVKSALSISAQSQASLQSQLAQERLKEAEQLSAEGKLNSQVKETLSNNFQSHADSFKKSVDKLKEQNDTKDANQEETDFETHLQEHQQIMGSLGIDNALQHATNASSTATTQLENLKTDFEAGKTPGSDSSENKTTMDLNTKFQLKTDGSTTDAAKEESTESSSESEMEGSTSPNMTTDSTTSKENTEVNLETSPDTKLTTSTTSNTNL